MIPGMQPLLAAAAIVLLALTAPDAQGRTTAELDRAGWDALTAGNIGEASAAFRAALRQSPTPTVLQKRFRVEIP